MKLACLILSIVVLLVAAILFVALSVSYKHMVDCLALGFAGLAVFAASFLPWPS
jgi:hypothetical protein